MPVHLVRRRPARESPTADEIIARPMKYRPVPISNVDEETPRPPQGETTAKPIPAPKDKRSRVNAQEAAAPAITAAQLTPEVVGSIRSVETTPVVCSMWSSSFPAHKMRGWNKWFRKAGVFLVA